MFSKFRNVLYNVVGGIDPLPVLKDAETSPEEINPSSSLSPKFQYSRPHFLQFNSDEEIQWSADHNIRPIIVPRDINKMPWNCGYAEAVNAGKSQWNEDQACIFKGFLQRPEGRHLSYLPVTLDNTTTLPDTLNAATTLPYVYFAMFDGHAGVGAAVAAAHQLHHIVQEKLVDIIDHLLPPLDEMPEHLMEKSTRKGSCMWFPAKEVSIESLIIGALESSFWDMDKLIAEDRTKYEMKGGCTALVSLFILGKLYVANAGDSRAVLCRENCAFPLSNDFTPETERHRIRRLAASQPELLGGEFTHLDYVRKPCEKDLGKRILYRDAYMTGWAYKTVTRADLKFPVVYGEGKRSRVLATIGVTRGFGDHDLKALYVNVPIKPFLLSQPEVYVLDLQLDITENDVLVMGTDGLWDVTSNERAAEIVQRSLGQMFVTEDARLKYRYTTAAQDLVMHSRGKLQERNWRTADGRAAAIDDISVFIVPLIPFKEEYVKWKHDHDAIHCLYDNAIDNTTLGTLTLKTSPAKDKKDADSEDLDAGAWNYSSDKELTSSLEVPPRRVEKHEVGCGPSKPKVAQKSEAVSTSDVITVDEATSMSDLSTYTGSGLTRERKLSLGLGYQAGTEGLPSRHEDSCASAKPTSSYVDSSRALIDPGSSSSAKSPKDSNTQPCA